MYLLRNLVGSTTTTSGLGDSVVPVVPPDACTLPALHIGSH